MTKLNYVKNARKDYPEIGVKKGEPYYWWKFRFGGKRMSKNKPPRSALTQSEFQGWLYDLEDEISSMSAEGQEDIESQRDDFVSRIEEMKDEIESRLGNMPDQLQDSDTGQLLQDRIDALTEWAEELQGVDCDIDEDELREKSEEDLDPDEDPEEKFNDLLQERIEEIISEIQSFTCNA